MVEELARDYSDYVKVDLKSELHDVQDSIDDMLTRLDEFENLVNMVKIDNELCSDISLPIILSSKQKLDGLCKQIDSLETLVSRVKSDMDIIEVQVEEAEAELGQSSGKLKNIFKPLLSKLSPSDAPVRRQNRTQPYTAPTLFKTSSFFPSQSEDAVQEQKS